MGRRGPPPKPTALKVIEGNRGRRPLNHDEPEPEPHVPSCPEHLNDIARAEWERITVELDKLGLVTEIDRAALAGYCASYSRWVEAETKIRELGTLVKSPNGYPMPSPYVSMADKALQTMNRFLTGFGMTPASRSQIKADKDGREKASPAAKYFAS